MKKMLEKSYMRFITARELKDYIGDLEKIGDVILQIEQVPGKTGETEAFLLEGIAGSDYERHKKKKAPA